MKGFDPKTSFGYETSMRYDALETRGDEQETVSSTWSITRSATCSVRTIKSAASRTQRDI